MALENPSAVTPGSKVWHVDRISFDVCEAKVTRRNKTYVWLEGHATVVYWSELFDSELDAWRELVEYATHDLKRSASTYASAMMEYNRVAAGRER